MSVERMVPDLASQSLDEAKHFYGLVLGLQPVMDHGWIVTLADPHNPSSQISLMTHDETAPVVPEVSIQVDDVDAAYAAALQAGSEIVHPSPTSPGGCGASSSATLTTTCSTCSVTAETVFRPN